MHQQRADIYTRITAEIATTIENGAGEWRMPWNHDGSSIARPRSGAALSEESRGWVHRFTRGVYGPDHSQNHSSKSA